MQDLQSNQAIIIKGVGGQYLLHRFQPFFKDSAMLRGIFRKDEIIPMPGDLIEYSASGDPDIPYVIDKILPRKNQLQRPPLANIDILLITVSLDLPKADYFLIDRLLSYAVFNQIQPFLILTKYDLISQVESNSLAELRANYEPTQFPIFVIGKDSDTELQRLKKQIKNQVVVLTGQSGVGKSTLLNRLFDKKIMLTGHLSKKAGRGKQTTRHIELFPYAESYIADTPGFQTVSLLNLNLEPQAFAATYPEFKALSPHCRFNNCTHHHEPNCAVLKADAKKIYPDRLKRYHQLRQEIENAKRKF